MVSDDVEVWRRWKLQGHELTHQMTAVESLLDLGGLGTLS